MDIITGKLKKFLYQTQSGWGIALFKATTGNLQVKIKGQIGLLEPKVAYELSGVFEQHPKYGKTFEVSGFKVVDLKTNDQYFNFFKDMVPGVGEVLAKRIIDTYQAPDLFPAILEQPEKLDHVHGLSAASKQRILSEIKKLLTENKLSTVFFNAGLKMDFLVNLQSNFFGEDGPETSDPLIERVLTTDFYGYAKRHKLVPFEEVDKVAMYFQKLAPDDLTRLAWSLNYVLEETLQQTGNTYTNKATLYRKLKDFRGVFDASVFEAVLEEALSLKLVFQQGPAYFSDESWNDELSISLHVINQLKQDGSGQPLTRNPNLIHEVEQDLAQELNIPNFAYDEQQQAALTKFIDHSFLLLNGGPGTGKTTVLKGMVRLFKKMWTGYGKPKIAIAAPTGRAAARINELGPDLHAKTIHKLLHARDGMFEYNATNPLEVDLLIVDESSMIENKIFARLLEAASLSTKIVFVGDENQLASVGYGEVFNNLLALEQIPKMNLSTIHRQAEGNGIIDLAYKILNNQISKIDDFDLPNITTSFNKTNQLGNVTEIFKESYERTLNLSEIQVITSFYKGQLGINKVNQELQAVYQNQIRPTLSDETPGIGFVRKDQTYYEGDKVMHLINDGPLGLNNGDVGYIKHLTIKDNKLINSVIDFNEGIKYLSAENFNNLTLSYGCSVHKTQGSEYEDVIFIVEPGINEFFLNQKLIYTAITRAKKNLYLVGDFHTFMRGILTPATKRKTGLVGRFNALWKQENII